MSATVPSRLPVFVCYAHTDNESPDPSKRWLDRLLEQLAPLAIQDQVCAWSDKDIETGQDWHDRIQQTLKNAKAAVLLVSPAFLASTYIRNSELSVLLKNAKDRGLVILPVIIRHCLFKEATFKYPDPVNGPEELALATLQSANSPTTPLNSLSEHEQDKVLLGVAQSLLAILHKSGPPQTSLGNFPKPIWNIPLERNPFFAGREDILGQIHEALLSTKKAAISGLGGIGKTQTAVEYAYRHKENYGQILWVKAESKESLTSDFAQLASLLNLPEKNVQNQQEVVKAVYRWLQQHEHWLLILDNADDLSLASPFIQGLQSDHILLTTRAQATGTISRVEVRKLPDQEGVVFLLRRAKLITKGTSYETILQELRTQALAIVKELDGLPLAMDQAGAYIEETQCGLAGYLELYNIHSGDLLRERGLFAAGHPEPVAKTWVLSFQKIKQNNPAAAELLTFCAFLHPDGIPEELITEGASELGPVLGPVAEDPISFNKVIGDILKFSLIHRDMNNKTLDIHRLVQAVIRKSLNDETQNNWIGRLVRAMNRVLPDVKFETWSQCDRLLPQAQECASYIFQKNLLLLEGARMLNQTAYYLYDRGRYPDAEPLYQRSLEIREKILGPTHSHVAVSLNNLGLLYHHQGKYTKAEKRYLRALDIQERTLGPMHPYVAQSLTNLGGIYLSQKQFDKVRQLSHRALRIYKLALGAINPEVTSSLNNLAVLYNEQGKYEKAKIFYQRALRINELTLVADHPKIAHSLNNLAYLYDSQKEYAKAEPLYQRALAIREQTLVPTHPDIATSLNNLAALYDAQGKYAEAEPLYQRALNIYEHELGPNVAEVAQSLNNLALLYYAQRQYAKAAPLLQRALPIREGTLGANHPNTQSMRRNYEDLLKKMESEEA
jgi:tetratricopeptide (TPR) repeat protein